MGVVCCSIWIDDHCTVCCGRVGDVKSPGKGIGTVYGAVQGDCNRTNCCCGAACCIERPCSGCSAIRTGESGLELAVAVAAAGPCKVEHCWKTYRRLQGYTGCQDWVECPGLGRTGCKSHGIGSGSGCCSRCSG